MLRSLRKVASGFLAGLMLLSASAMAENVPNDVPLQQIAAEAGADNYYQEAIKTEIYNYKLVRNLPTTFTQDTWETYCSLANGLMDLDAENLADVKWWTTPSQRVKRWYSRSRWRSPSGIFGARISQPLRKTPLLWNLPWTLTTTRTLYLS